MEGEKVLFGEDIRRADVETCSSLILLSLSSFFLQQATELKWRNAAWEGGKVLFSEDEALVGIKSLTVTDPVHEVSIWSLTQKNSSQLTKELFWLWRLLRPLLLSQLGQDAPPPGRLAGWLVTRWSPPLQMLVNEPGAKI